MKSDISMNAVKKKSLFQEAMSRFFRIKTAMFGMAFIVVIVAVCLLAGVICPEGYDAQNIGSRFLAPGSGGILGTDDLGRSMLARVLYGGRISLLVAFGSTSLSLIFGTVLGAVAGFYQGRVDDVIMRILDVFSAIPSLLLAMVISATLGTGLVNTMIAVAVPAMPSVARMVRGPILTVKDQEYVEAAGAIDARDSRIIFKHILPNVLSPLIIKTTMSLAQALLFTASLSFLGLGVQPPMPEWGALISTGRKYILSYPYLVTVPGCFIAVTVLSINLIGDGLRDALDPRMKN